MNIRLIIGGPHSLQRYIVFGYLSGGLAVAVSVFLKLPFIIVGPVASAIAGWTAGIPLKGDPGQEILTPKI